MFISYPIILDDDSEIEENLSENESNLQFEKSLRDKPVVGNNRIDLLPLAHIN